MEHRSFFNGDGFVQLRFLGLKAQATADEYEDKDDLKAIMEVSQMLRCAIDNYQSFIDKLDTATESESTKKIKVSALTYIADVFKQIFQKLG